MRSVQFSSRKWLLGSFVVAGLGASTAFGVAPNAQVEKAIQFQYGMDAKGDVVGTHNVNGVAVDEVKVTAKNGTATANVTEAGDFLLSENIRKGDNLPAGARDTVQGVFKGNPADVESFIATKYDITLNENGHDVRATVDAAGRLRDLQGQKELGKVTSGSSYSKASDAELNAVRGPIEARFGNLKLTEGFKSSDLPNFIIAHFKTTDGKATGQIIADANGDFYSWRATIAEADLTPAVKKTLDEVFPGAKVEKVERTQNEYYQFNQNLSSGELTIQIKPNGDIINVEDHAAKTEEQAMSKSAGNQARTASDMIGVKKK